LGFNSVLKTRIFGAAIVLFLLTLSPLALFAEWYKDYESAQKNIKKGQWGDAIPRLKAALSEKRDEANNLKFYGMKFDDYFPHFYLGLAYFGLKDYKNALIEFEQSEKIGAIKQRPDLFKQLTDAKTVAHAQVVTAEPSRPVETSVPKIPPAPLPQQEKIEKPVETVNPPADPKPQNEPASTKIEDAARTDPPTTSAVPRPEPPAATPSTLEPAPVPVAVEASAGVKKMMQEGARKFFEGNYDSAIRILSEAIEANPKDASAPFLLGCSYAAKYLLTGSIDKGLYQKAESAFRKSRRIDPDYKIANSSYISPAVLQIYESS